MEKSSTKDCDDVLSFLINKTKNKTKYCLLHSSPKSILIKWNYPTKLLKVVLRENMTDTEFAGLSQAFLYLYSGKIGQ